MPGVTPEPSEERKSAINWGYGAAIAVAFILLVITSSSSGLDSLPLPGGVSPFLPIVAGLIAYLLSHNIGKNQNEE